MSKDFGVVNPEQQKTIAGDIYSALQAERGITSLSGFNHGEIIFAHIKRRIKIVRLSIADFEREMFRERGFNDIDIQSGITAVIEDEFRNPEWPSAPFVPEPQLRYFNVSGTGKVVEKNSLEEEAIPSKLEPYHIDAIQRVTRLSIIPRQILEVFGSYAEFIKQLGQRDMAGIDKGEQTPSQIEYNGGLREFVRALELKEKGELGKLDTSLHALKDSLDGRDHFTKLAEILNRFHQQ